MRAERENSVVFQGRVPLSCGLAVSLAVKLNITPLPSDRTTAASGYAEAHARALAVGASASAADSMYPASPSAPGVSSGGLLPAVSAGQIINSWCVSELHNGNAWATGCDLRTVVGASGNDWYWMDDMTSSAQDSSGVAGLINDHLWMTYPSSDQVVKWVPNSTQTTNCQNDSIGISASAYGFTLSETSNNTICNGHGDPNINTSWGGYFGANWTLNNNHTQHSVIGIEPIAEVHAPTANQGSVLHLTFHSL